MTNGDPATLPPVPPDTRNGWEDPPRRHSADSAPVLAVEGVAGPIDWLVEQVRAGRIDLARLPVLALVDAFVDALATALDGTNGSGPDKEEAGTRPAAPAGTVLARWGAWLVLAAELALLRSRLLLAGSAEAPAAAEQAEALRRQIRERAFIAAAADWLERRPQLGRDVWARGRPEIKPRAGRVGDVTALLRACLVVLRVPDEAAAFRVRVPFWSLAEAAARIRALLPKAGEKGVPLERFLPEVTREGPDYGLRCRAAVASTFTAGLELAREGDVALQQEVVWQPVQLERGSVRACE